MAKFVPAESVDTAFVMGRSAFDSFRPEDEQPANAKVAAAAMASAPPVARQEVLIF
ncbi:hypothetical protein [Terrabacter sp. NPDC080008]|uniref:hypothetical protein n=1 Tax=Terrabacter sp. NPDC080008 TaxID=3155176 RepID=UPI00344D3DA0